MLITHWCLVPSQAYPKSRAFQCPALVSYTRSWRGTWSGQLTQISQRNILYHRIFCSVYKPGELAKRCQSLLGDRESMGQWVLSNCIEHHLTSGVYSFLTFSYYYHMFLPCNIWNVHISAHGFSLVPFTSPFHWGGEWVDMYDDYRLQVFSWVNKCLFSSTGQHHRSIFRK